VLSNQGVDLPAERLGRVRQFIMGQAAEIGLKPPEQVGNAGGEVIHFEKKPHPRFAQRRG
jgi:hypothetical protein